MGEEERRVEEEEEWKHVEETRRNERLHRGQNETTSDDILRECDEA